MLEGKIQTHPSTLYMDGTSPVTVNVRSTTDELREIHNQSVVILTQDEWYKVQGDIEYYQDMAYPDE